MRTRLAVRFNIAAGEYTDVFTVNKHVKLVGAGSGSHNGSNTILKMSAVRAAVTVTGSAFRVNV